MTEQERKAPAQIDPEPFEDGGSIHLPSLISDEFGISRLVAEDEALIGDIYIDGELFTPKERDLNIPVKDIIGKNILVKGRTRHFALTYNVERFEG